MVLLSIYGVQVAYSLNYMLENLSCLEEQRYFLSVIFFSQILKGIALPVTPKKRIADKNNTVKEAGKKIKEQELLLTSIPFFKSGSTEWYSLRYSKVRPDMLLWNNSLFLKWHFTMTVFLNCLFGRQESQMLELSFSFLYLVWPSPSACLVNLLLFRISVVTYSNRTLKKTISHFSIKENTTYNVWQPGIYDVQSQYAFINQIRLKCARTWM